MSLLDIQLFAFQVLVDEGDETFPVFFFLEFADAADLAKFFHRRGTYAA